MPFDTKTVQNIGQIPDLITAFASQCGFATAAGGQITLPSGVTCNVTATDVPAPGYGVIAIAASDGNGGCFAEVHSPQISGRDPFRSAPSELRMYGRSSGTPFLAIVIRYQAGEYRHLYMGTLDKVGVFDGGEIIGAANPNDIKVDPGRNMDPQGWADRGNGYIFGGQSGRPLVMKGGVRILHPRNADNPWRTFGGPGLVFPSPLIGAAFGGLLDEINDATFLNGTNGFAGGPELTPIPIYAVMPNGKYICVGTPAGIRAANLVDLDPGAVVAVASDRWRVFPQWWRTNVDLLPYATPSGSVIAGNGDSAGFRIVNSKWYGLGYQEA